MFNLSGHSELLFLLCFIASCSECDVISLYFMCCSVNGSIYLVCCVFVNCLVKQFAMCLGVVAILLLNVMVLQRVCVCCACERLNAHFICFVCVLYVRSYLLI